MTLRGRIRNGNVVFDEPVELPEGAVVTIAFDSAAERSSDDDAGPTLFERLEPVFGIANDLPPDGSRKLDHYLYGAPKE